MKALIKVLCEIRDILYDLTYLTEVQRREKHRHLTHDIEH